MVELCGLKVRTEASPDGDVGIEVIGLRPGEKLHEELLIGNNPQHTAHQRIMRAQEEFLPLARLRSELEALRQMLREDGEAGALALLHRLVPEFRRADAPAEPSPEPEEALAAASPALSPAPLGDEPGGYPAVTPLVAKGAAGR